MAVAVFEPVKIKAIFFGCNLLLNKNTVLSVLITHEKISTDSYATFFKTAQGDITRGVVGEDTGTPSPTILWMGRVPTVKRNPTGHSFI